jgi:hypothetical protein
VTIPESENLRSVFMSLAPSVACFVIEEIKQNIHEDICCNRRVVRVNTIATIDIIECRGGHRISATKNRRFGAVLCSGGLFYPVL